MATQHETGLKWRFNTTFKTATPVDKLWKLLVDLNSIDKWFPGLTSFEVVEGDGYSPGSIRKLTFAGVEVHEKLLTVNPIEHIFEYKLLQNSMGFQNYTGRIKIEESDGGKGNIIKWSVEADPVEGKSEEETMRFVSITLQESLRKLETAANSL